MSKYNEKALEKALRAIFDGPQKKKVKIKKHKFNFKPIQIQRSGGRLLVNGNKGHQISHHLKWRPDDQVFYEFEVSRTGKIENIEVKISKGSDKLMEWVEKAAKLIEIIGEMKEGGGQAKADSADLERAIRAGDPAILLNGGWRGEAMFVIATTMFRLAAQQRAQTFSAGAQPVALIPRGRRAAALAAYAL